MDGRLPWHEDRAETSSPHPPKRQKTFHDDLGNGVQESRNGSLTSHDQYTIAWICALHIEMDMGSHRRYAGYELARGTPHCSHSLAGEHVGAVASASSYCCGEVFRDLLGATACMG
ncbi:hypothetical protein EDB81DRAFT_770939 [Dactylonectria macrodidyma]|uniref:Uncharacterized protein n=1 Tax=Dactylonectria macrodidyma TaxID=307937 RepID=A0A9P9FRE8_9HYPO|nr:hypothetical protein EDB81DRAFT_770939 [Dactylonectria macrodidyma]